jgi:hypothetical protein
MSKAAAKLNWKANWMEVRRLESCHLAELDAAKRDRKAAPVWEAGPAKGSPAAKAMSRLAYQGMKNKKPKQKSHARDGKISALTLLAYDD